MNWGELLLFKYVLGFFRLTLFLTTLVGPNLFAQTSKLLERAQDFDLREIHLNFIRMMIETDFASPSYTQNFWNLIIDQVHAADGKRCFYGGWASIRVGGECKPPWVAKKSGAFAKDFAGHLYTSEFSCGGSALMRCNPLLFGASTTEGGKCVQIAPTGTLTQRCALESRELQAEHLELLKNDELTREKYAELLDEVMNYCQEDKKGSDCYHLARQIQVVLDQIAAEGDGKLCEQVLEPVLNTDNFKNLLSVLDTPPKVVSDKWAAPLDPDFEVACAIEGMSEEAQKNCQDLLASGDVPTNALLFALDGLKRNSTSFKTNECFDKAAGFNNVFSHFSTPGVSNKGDFMANLGSGIKNKCTMIINDYDDRLKTHGGAYQCQTRMYYIDLCQSEPKVTKSYSYVGYGTCKNKKGFLNETGQGTSLIGFSVTNDKAFSFGKSDKSYNAIRKSMGGRIPSVSLFGLQNTNNRSSVDYKYLHVGAYTSAGCPSIDPKNGWMIDKLANEGPSVVVGYKEGEMESFDKCGDE